MRPPAAVTITHAPHSMFYAYGPMDGEAVLELGRPHSLVRIRPEIADDDTRSGDITFTNGAYEYTVYKNGDLSAEGDKSAPTDAFTGGLVVYKDGDSTAPIFEYSCILGRSINRVFPSSNHQ